MPRTPDWAASTGASAHPAAAWSAPNRQSWRRLTPVHSARRHAGAPVPQLGQSVHRAACVHAGAQGPSARLRVQLPRQRCWLQRDAALLRRQRHACCRQQGLHARGVAGCGAAVQQDHSCRAGGGGAELGQGAAALRIGGLIRANGLIRASAGAGPLQAQKRPAAQESCARQKLGGAAAQTNQVSPCCSLARTPLTAVPQCAVGIAACRQVARRLGQPAAALPGVAGARGQPRGAGIRRVGGLVLPDGGKSLQEGQGGHGGWLQMSTAKQASTGVQPTALGCHRASSVGGLMDSAPARGLLLHSPARTGCARQHRGLLRHPGRPPPQHLPPAWNARRRRAPSPGTVLLG